MVNHPSPYGQMGKDSPPRKTGNLINYPPPVKLTPIKVSFLISSEDLAHEC
jgi:hypothetical protein